MFDELCSYGCNQTAIIQFKNKKFCCSKASGACPVNKKKNSQGVKRYISNFEDPNDRWKNGHPKGAKDKISPFKGLTYEEMYNDRVESIKAKQSEKRKLQEPYFHTEETKNRLSNVAKENGYGGYKERSGRGRKGRYKGYWCDSSWELAWIIYNLDHNIEFDRNTKKFPYVFNDKAYNWIPDFKMKDDSYVEIKGYMTLVAEAKIKTFSEPLKVIDKTGINKYIDYVVSKYGRDYISLYESQ